MISLYIPSILTKLLVKESTIESLSVSDAWTNFLYDCGNRGNMGCHKRGRHVSTNKKVGQKPISTDS